MQLRSVAIDFGTVRTKVAAFDETAGKPVMRAEIPTLVYVAEHGRILTGEEAEVAGASDPDGLVRDLKKKIGATLRIRKDQTVRPTDMLAALFRRIRLDAQRWLFQGEPLNSCCLATPIGFDSRQRDSLKESARLAGWAEVLEVEEPIAVASRWKPAQGLTPTHLVVADIGAGATDITLLMRKGDLWQMRSPLPPEIIDGGYIDNDVWKLLVSGIRSSGTYEKFIGDLLCHLRQFSAGMKMHRISAPLVLTGGGSKVPGLEAAIRTDSWPGEVQACAEPEHSAVLGAVAYAASLAVKGVSPQRRMGPHRAYDPDQGA